jgi:ABC-type multidrug transport system fused ATPase/permease subunit
MTSIFSLERIQEYTVIEQEPKASEGGIPPAYWPASGDLRVEKLCARYSADRPRVLHEVSFHIKSGERVGVVGRTGSGKSSLTLSLLRCINTEGDVYFDGLPTSLMNLESLREKVTIIPQVVSMHSICVQNRDLRCHSQSY